MDDIQIDKGIPVPQKQARFHKAYDLYQKMEVGDSILVDNWSEARSIRKAILKLHNKSCTVRKEGDEYRVWMIEPST